MAELLAVQAPPLKVRGALLEVEDFAVAYCVGGTSVHAVDGVDFAMPAGAMLGLVGKCAEKLRFFLIWL